MASYSGELIKLNGQTIPYITSYKIGRNKLWGEDTGRNMAGKMKGSLIGVFPKIILEIGYITDEELVTLENILDAPSITVEYYSNKYKTTKTGSFYASDYEENLVRKNDMMYGPFSVNLIPIESEEYHV